LARTSLRNAARYVKTNFDAAATTRKQLLLVCRATGISTNILDILPVPTVLHYYGSGPFGLGQHSHARRGAQDLIHRITEYLTQNNVGYAYGCLAAGGDILCAEACLRANVELHVVLPFDKDEFVQSMVGVDGPSWIHRFDDCLRSAQSVTFATTDAYRGDHELLTYAFRLTMGVAILRATHLATKALHLRLKTAARERNNPAYTTALNMWIAQGHKVHSLAAPNDVSVFRKRARRTSLHRDRMPPRFSRALIFGDVAGFSRVPDYLRPAFQKHFLGTIASILRRFRRHILYRNSWGDAIYIVMDDPIFAADCCLAIQEATSKPSWSRYGLPSELALRLAAHFGPVYDGQDPIRDEQTFFGGHATLAARMEPVTPPGGVYVTEAMAASLAIANHTRLHVEYVGNTPLAKGFGVVRMYSLVSSRLHAGASFDVQ
jgi:class 3 adenylate cyclase